MTGIALITALICFRLPDISYIRRVTDLLKKTTTTHKLVTALILIVTVAIYVLQVRSLYTVPVYDSVRWGGDETWLMREFGNQAAHGAMSYPETFGSPTRTDGLLAGSMWVDALIYGETGRIFSPAHDLIGTGRTVTAILGFALIASLFLILRQLDVNPILAAGSIAVMVVSQGFVWVTHCARYDLLTGLALIWYCAYLANFSCRELYSLFDFLLFGAAAFVLIIFSRHLLTLGLPVTFVCILFLRLWRKPKLIVSALAGGLLAALILSLAYAFGAGEFSLFGRGGSMGSYGFVLQQIPIMRPFSRNVQLSNLAERWSLFEKDIPGLLTLIMICIFLILLYKGWQWQLKRKGTLLKIATSTSQRFFLLAAALCSISWVLLQGSRPYYLFHIVPILLIACAVVLQLWLDVYQNRWHGPIFVVLILLSAITLQAQHALPDVTLGEAVCKDQRAGIAHLLASTPMNSHPKCRVLVDVAGLDWALMDTSREILTLDMFQPPANESTTISKLQQNKIDFVILRSSPVGGVFEPGRALLPHLLDSIGELRDSSLGFFYDDGRSYDADLSTMINQGLDTLKLYSLNTRNFNSSTP